MKKTISILLILATVLSLCACGKTGATDSVESTGHTVRSDAETNQNETATALTETICVEESINDLILGAWCTEEIHSGFQVISFREDGSCYIIHGKLRADFEIMDGISYEITEENNLVLHSSDGEQLQLTIVMRDDVLILVDEDGENNYVKVSKNTSVVGQWLLINSQGVEEIIINRQTRVIHRIVLYNDGSYTMGRIDESKYSRTYYGKYEIIHDGGMLCLDGNYYLDIEFPAPGIMALYPVSSDQKLLFMYVG